MEIAHFHPRIFGLASFSPAFSVAAFSVSPMPAANDYCSTILRLVHLDAQVDSAFYPPWDGKMSTIQRAVMLWGWEGNRRPSGK